MQRFNFNSDYSFFHNILVEKDTLIIAGASMQEGQLEAMLVKIDTMGNILQTSFHRDSLGRHLSFQEGYPLIKTQRNTYMTAGDPLGGTGAVCLIEWNSFGNVVNYWEYPYVGDIIVSMPKEVIEIEDGFLFFLDSQLSNSKSVIQILKLSPEGKVIWRKTIQNINDIYYTSLFRKNENELVISAPIGTNVPMGKSKCIKDWIFAIDTTGKKLWEWYGVPCEVSGGYGLHLTEDNEWIYGAVEAKVINDISKERAWAPYLVKRDSAFNLIWGHRTAESYSEYSKINSLLPTPDGNWIAAGSWVLPEPYYNDLHISNLNACLYKITSTGEQVWSRCDTFPVSTGEADYHEYSSHVVLPSGSAVAVGSFRTLEDNNLWAWVVKVHKNGCIESETCNQDTTATDIIDNHALDLRVYPNPATDKLYVHIEKVQPGMVFTIADQLGKTMQETIVQPDYKKYQVDISDLSPGVYFYHLRVEGRTFNSGKIIVQ